jgi:hypothetical protein
MNGVQPVGLRMVCQMRPSAVRPPTWSMDGFSGMRSVYRNRPGGARRL